MGIRRPVFHSHLRPFLSASLRRFICTSLLLILVSASTLQAKDKWILLTSPHFQTVSNAGERRAKRLVEQLEQFRYLLVQLFGLKGLERLPVTVFVFKNDKSFKPYKPLYQGKPKNVAGFFQPGPDRNLIALNARSRGNPLRSVHHEYVHLIASYTPNSLPLWVNEGMAELYSTFEASSKKATIGAPIDHHLDLLQTRGLLPLQEFFQVNHSSPEYNETRKQGMFYAQSWLLMHFLTLGNRAEHQQGLVHFLKLLEMGADSNEAFAGAFPTLSLEQLTNELARYARRRAFLVSQVKIERKNAAHDFGVSPLGEGEAMAHLGDLLLYGNRGEEAAEHYRQALETGSQSAHPYEGLAMVAAKNDNMEKAEEYLQAALARDSTSYLVHYRWAELQMDRLGFMKDLPANVAYETLDPIERSLLRAVELAPGFDRGHYLLATLCLRSGRNAELGIEAIQKALVLKPQDFYYRLTLADLQMETSDYDGAEETLTRLANSEHNEITRFVDSRLDYLQFLKRQSSMGNGGANPPPAADVQLTHKSVPSTEIDVSGARPQLKRTPNQASGPATLPPSQTDCWPPGINVGGHPAVYVRIQSLECDSGQPIFVAFVEGREERLVPTDPSQLGVYSCSVQLQQLQCGPFSYGANVYFVPGFERDPTTGALKYLAIEIKGP